jgi:glycosyltransferase involved in cell wall biosynthesis
MALSWALFEGYVCLAHEDEPMLTRAQDSDAAPPLRLLIFVVAYEAETTLEQVLARIPESIFVHDTEVLVIDDSSKDRTFEVGLRSSFNGRHRTTVLYNKRNQGYGGNQKLGYQYAIRHDFDAVVLLHGDGQYAPECIPALIAPLLDGSAEAVFGSRMLVPGAAKKGGMPLYKFVGNKILTWIQNRLLGSKLSEFHSGFRAYSVAALKKIPFEHNSNVFHFDTEVIIQLMLAGQRIVEVPIPTYYGDEICRVNGIKYAKDVVKATIASRLHRVNIFYDRKFDIAGATNTHYDLKLGYASSHSMALDVVPPGSRVLDIGCGPGAFDEQLAVKGCAVTGVDQFPPARAQAFEDFALWNESGPFPDMDLRRYDYVLLLDIIEHLKHPEAFLERLRNASHDHRPTFIVTSGNVVFLIVRVQALLGNFNYGKRGILDLTHTRLYTFRSLKALFEQCGFDVERVAGIPAPFPKALGLNAVSRALLRINQLLIRLSKGLFAYQIFLTVSPRLSVDGLLDASIKTAQEKTERLSPMLHG